MSNNPDKVHELRTLLRDVPLDVRSYKDVIGEPLDVVEDGETYAENALKKVLAPPERSDTIYLSDDSGMEVTALDSAPGIYSARYAGVGCSYADNCRKVIGAMRGKTDRSARFLCVLALRFPDPEHFPPQTVTGIVEGEILSDWEEGEGFGYDPVFVPSGYDRPFSAFSEQEKNAISHRGKALVQAKALLLQYLQRVSSPPHL
ncbi:MAG: non-canonical purine NTP pyrophosphatase [bacterium]